MEPVAGDRSGPRAGLSAESNQSRHNERPVPGRPPPAGVEVPAEKTDAGEAAPSYVHQSRAVARAIAPPGSAGRDHRQPPLRWRRPPRRRNPPQAAPARREDVRDYERPKAPHRRHEGPLAPDDDERISSRPSAPR